MNFFTQYSRKEMRQIILGLINEIEDTFQTMFHELDPELHTEFVCAFNTNDANQLQDLINKLRNYKK